MPDDKARNAETEEVDEDEPDAPTKIGEIDETLLKALKQRGMPDAQILAAPKSKETPTQPPPPMSDEDESATNVVIPESAPPVIIARPPLPTTTIADEDQSETLSAVTGIAGSGPIHRRDPRLETTANIGCKEHPLRRWAIPIVIFALLAFAIAWTIIKG